MEKWEIEFEEMKKEKHSLAKKIWDIPFAVNNLNKLTKKELLVLIDCMLDRIACDYKDDWFEMDWKVILFDQKCWLIESIDSKFFSKKE